MQNLIKGEEGFFIIDMMIASVFLIAIVSLLFFMGNANRINHQRANHITAIFLAQEYLNKLEYELKHEDLSVELNDEKINYNECDFVIKKDLWQIGENSYSVKIEVKWNYEDILQNEIQKREIYLLP